jgi:hypothetical protein
MEPREHIRVTGFALKNWAVAQVQDSIAVALLWLLGPLDPQSAMGSAVGSACCRPANRAAPRTSTQSGRPGAGDIAPPARLGTSPLRADPVRTNRSRGRPVAPALHHARVAKVPMWASIVAPVILGFAIPFWGFILAPPLLAVIYAYKARGPRR